MAEDSATPELDDTVSRLHRWYKDAEDHSDKWREAAREAYDFESGRQWDEETLSTLKEERRPAVVFNRVLRIVNAVVGTEINNRQETRYLPREQGDVQINEILTGAAEWARDESDAEDEESEAFRDLVVCGMGWTDTRMDFDQDPDGMIAEDRVDPLHMWWDPGARKKNLSDRRWQMRLHFFDQDEFWSTWPKAEGVTTTSPWDGGADEDVSSGRHTYPQEAYGDAGGRDGPKQRRQIKVMQAQWWEFGTVYRVGGDAAEFSEEKFAAIRKEIEKRGIPFLKQKRKVFKQAYVAAGQVLEEGACPCDHAFTYTAMTGLRDRNKNIWQGLVEVMKDPQRWGNTFFSQSLDILNKGAKGGILIEEDATDDVRKLEQDWARPDAVHVLRPGAISKSKIIPKPVVDLPRALDKLMAVAYDGVQDVSGVSLEFLALADRDQSGVLEYQRKQAGMTILAPFFDALRKFRKEQGRVLLHFIQTYISDGRLIRITGRDGNEQYVPLVADEATAKYDVIVDEGPTSPNQKERVFGALTNLLPVLMKAGVPMPPELLDYAPIPSALATKWKQLIQQGSQLPPEVQKRMEQLTEENRKLKDKRQEAMAKLQLGQAEAQASGQLDQAQAEARAALERQKAELDQWKMGQAAALEQEKVQAQLDVERFKVEQNLALQREKTEAELAIKMAQATGGENGELNLEAVRRIFRDDEPKHRHITVNRNTDGFIESADIEEVLESMEPQGSA